MTEHLDKIIDSYMKVKAADIEKYAAEGNEEELLQKIRAVTKQEIVDEVKQQYKEELAEEMNKEIQKKAALEKIKQLKKLMWTGFVVAFVVGLLVNQVTDIIGFIKGSVHLNNIMPTIIIIIVLLVISIIMYMYTFVKDAVDAYREVKKEII